jgi:hypothetical protein
MFVQQTLELPKGRFVRETKAARLREELLAQHGGAFETLRVETLISLLDATPSEKPYHFLTDRTEDLLSGIRREHGETGFELLQKLALLRLIETFSSRAVGKRYTDAIRECFGRSYDRIIRSIEDPSFSHYRTVNDILLKDLALCRQKMFPAGAQVVEPASAFHRALLYRGGVRQALQVIQLLLVTGGNRGWYQNHTHLSELEEFNPEGRDRFYLRIADMLAVNPDAKGMWGGSWFYDPELERVSPRLVYLRERPQANGAFVFYSNVDLKGGALSKSKSRRELYERGEYLPKAYALIWPRRRMIAWAARFRSGAPAAQLPQDA